MNSFIDLAHERYSVRKFSNRAVEQEKIDKIVEAGMAAPTAVNIQPVKIWTVQTQEGLEKIRTSTPFPFVKQAQVVFVIGSNPEEGWVRQFDGKSFSDIDAAIVATHMILEVQDLGLGTTWVGHFDPNKVKELFPETKDYNLIALFPVGYPADDATPSNTHSKSKPKESVVTVL